MAAALIVVGGIVHLKLYNDGYQDFPDHNLGRSFLLNARRRGGPARHPGAAAPPGHLDLSGASALALRVGSSVRRRPR